MANRKIVIPLIVSLVFAGRILALDRDPETEAPPIAVRVDPRLELLAIVFRLAGNREFNLPNSQSPYSADVAAHFTQWVEHPAIVRARELRSQYGVSYDAVASLAMHARGIDELTIGDGTSGTWDRLDSRWTLALANDFLASVATFRDDSRFSEFFAAHGSTYSKVEDRMRDLLRRKLDGSWFARFFGTKAAASFTVHPGLLLGGHNFGVGVRYPEGREAITPCIGCWEYDAEGVPIFPDSVLPTIVHEFCHSYVNPIVDSHGDAFDLPGAAIFPSLREVMESQAYGRWRIVVYESIVRAAVVRYLIAHEDESVVENELAMNERSHFVWIRELSALLGEYEATRNSHPTLDAFVPRLVDFFEELAEQEATQPAKPVLVAMEPKNGELSVSPTTTQIVLRFDREMSDGMSIMVSGNKDRFPSLGPKKAHWDPDRTVLRIDVRLEPNKDYEFGLNTGSARNFASREGVSLDPIVIRFRTGDG